MFNFHRKRPLGNAIEGFLLSKKAEGCAAKTIEWYHDRLGWLVKSFTSDIEIRSIKTQGIQTLLVELQNRNLSRVTIWDTLRAVKWFFRWCKARSFVAADPTSEIKNIKIPKQFPRLAQLSDVKLLLDACDLNRFEGIRNFTMILLLVDTGIRRGELTAIHLGDVNEGKRAIVIRNGKGGDSRMVFFGELMKTRFKAWMETRGPQEGPLFCGKDGSALKGRSVCTSFDRLAQRAGLKAKAKISPHKLRHTAATLLAMGGMNAFSLAQLLGHADAKTTQIYTHLGGMVLFEAYNQCSPVDKNLLGFYSLPVEPPRFVAKYNSDAKSEDMTPEATFPNVDKAAPTA